MKKCSAPGTASQHHAAEQLAREHGYATLERAVVPGSGHAPFAARVVSYFATLLSR